MTVEPESIDRKPVPAEPRRVFFAVRLPFLLLGLGAVSYGLTQHRSSWWTIGMIWLGSSCSGWLSDVWIRREWPVPTPARQSKLSVKAYMIVMPFFVIASIVFLIAFPNWFPNACPLPSR